MLLSTMTAGDTAPLAMRALHPVTREPQPLVGIDAVKFFFATEKGQALLTAKDCDITLWESGVFKYPWLIGETTDLTPGTYRAHFQFRKQRQTALWTNAPNDPGGNPHAPGDPMSATVTNPGNGLTASLTSLVQPPTGNPTKVAFECTAAASVAYEVKGLDEWGVAVTETGSGQSFETTNYFQKITSAKFTAGDAGVWGVQLQLGTGKVTSAEASRKPTQGYLTVLVQARSQ
jgi:hypothetical protein